MTHKINAAYTIVRSRYSTEKTSMQQGLLAATSSKSLATCTSAQYTFMVDVNATKPEIANAIEVIYSEAGIKVLKVRTIRTKPKVKRIRRQKGMTSVRKKAIVTLASGQKLPE